MKRRKSILLLAGLVTLAACGPAGEPRSESESEPTAIDSTTYRFDTLILDLMGDWTDAESHPGAVIHERWKRTDDGSYSGIGFVMVEKDTVFIEHLVLSADSAGRVAYRVRVPSQNAGGTVAFALTQCIGDSMVFENPAHDFPQRISYTLQPDGLWNARVSGPGKDGALRMDRYHFKRVDR